MVLMPEGSGQWGLRSRAVNTSFYGARLPSMSSGVRSANPATSCASGRSGLRRAHISGSTGNVVAFGMPAPSKEGFRAVSSDGSSQFAVSEREKNSIFVNSELLITPTQQASHFKNNVAMRGIILQHSKKKMFVSKDRAVALLAAFFNGAKIL